MNHAPTHIRSYTSITASGDVVIWYELIGSDGWPMFESTDKELIEKYSKSVNSHEKLLHLCKSALDCAQQEIDGGNKKWVTMRNHFQKAIQEAESNELQTID